jgi:hypothetical protein
VVPFPQEQSAMNDICRGMKFSTGRESLQEGVRSNTILKSGELELRTLVH